MKSQQSCPPLCTKTRYNPEVLNFHRNAEKGTSCDSEYILFMYFTIDPVAITKEYLVYDTMAIISAIGGTLGLLLGYSILSILLSLIKHLE